MKVVLISTYELGHQPFGVASLAAWLRARGAVVTCFDLSREALREEPVREARLVAFYVPMHTATRLAVQLVGPVRRLNPSAHLCFYGLYAPINEALFRELGAVERKIQLALHSFRVGMATERDVAGEQRLLAVEDVDVDRPRPGVDQHDHRAGVQPVVGFAGVLKGERVASTMTAAQPA